ncbi:MAG: VacB/RNase II family 3'-5' exoribonuclease [Phycisphaeraceae bacterium]|jgi:ribonuclease R|nr:VacB/RNase II family 3'-5' exoribonuclease [Phycisphaeraceae bacterium]
MSDYYQRRILKHLSDARYLPGDLAELAAGLGVDDAQRDDFYRAAQGLISAGKVILGASKALALPPPGCEMQGIFRLHERGFGFLVPDNPNQHGDLFVPEGSTGGAMTGDHVLASVLHRPQRGRRGDDARSPYVGKIERIIQRADRRYTGNLTRRGSQWLVHIDGKTLAQPVVVRDPHAKNAKEGDKVVVELIEYPEDRTLGEAVITEVLGETDEPDVETLAVMRTFGLDDRFPDKVIDEARQVARRFDENEVPAKREDLTARFSCTIDPPDAKDYDDAISIECLDADGSDAVYELGVHIADVAHFVTRDSVLDAEAQRRGNSTYLPRKVVPMLPELLSNGVCSLQEGVNRWCKSAFIQYDAQGHVVGQRLANTVIRSAKRLTYLEAQALIDGDMRAARTHAVTEPNHSEPVKQALADMNTLARSIRQRRLDEGMMVLDLPDAQLVFDEAGRVSDAVPEDDAFTHTIIEMFMVEANEAVARVFDSANVPLLRRIHPDPPSLDMADLRQFARVAGYNIPKNPSRQELQSLLRQVQGKPAQHAVHLAVLRTLSKAEYAPLNVGHFALASEHYAHFTSPIRRYPDLTVHRAVDAYLDATRSRKHSGGRSRNQLTRDLCEDARCLDEVALSELGRHCSTTERNSESAERSLREYLVLELLSHHLGEEFDGVVTGVTGAGIFVELEKYLTDGFIRIADLPTRDGGSQQWKVNRSTGAMVAQRSGEAIQIGDRITVRIARVDPSARQLDLVIVDLGAAAGTKTKRRQPKGAKAAHQQTMLLKRVKKHEKPGPGTAGKRKMRQMSRKARRR